MKIFPCLLVLVVGVAGFLLGRRVEHQPVANVGGAPASPAVAPPSKTNLTKNAERNRAVVDTKKLLPGIDLSSPAKCMEVGRTLGSNLYSAEPALLINTLESALSNLPEHLRPAFWQGFTESLQQIETTSGHIEKLSGLDTKLISFLNSAKIRGNEQALDRIISSILVQGVVQNPDETAEKILNLPKATNEQTLVHDKLLTGIAASKVLRNPKEGLILIEQLEPKLRKDLGYQLIRGLSVVDASEALGYFLSNRYLGKADSATAALTLQNYVEISPEQASAQIRDAPPSPQKDEAAKYLSSRIAQTDFESALVWAESIANPALREQAIKDVHDRQTNPVPSVIDLIKSN